MLTGGSESSALQARLEPAGLFVAALLAGVWSWWTWQHGGYFETVWLPGTIILCVGATLLLLLAPAHRPRGAALVCVLALGALGSWTLLSAIWSPAPETAVADGQRVLMYALSLGLGLWLGRWLGPRILLALAPFAIAAAVGAGVTVVEMFSADTPDGLLEEGVLDAPLGYHNANAAFFLIAFFPALGLAASRDLDWRLRGLATATATLCLELAMLSQSRASMPAMALAVTLYALLSPLRARALCWLALAVLPALGLLPGLLELFDVATAEPLVPAQILAELEDTGLAIVGTASIALVAGLLAARFEHRLPGLGSTTPRWNRAVAGGLAALALAAGAGFIAVTGDPAGWIEDRWEEFRSQGTPETEDLSSRFVFNAGTERDDVWRVALEDFSAEPVFGVGAGGFQYSYTAEREVGYQDVRDAHSVELELLAELGVPGLAMLLVALIAIAVAILRARRSGPATATLAAIGLAAGGYWLVHASVDWFWAYPGVTASTLALLGAAAAPGVAHGGPASSRLGRKLGVIALTALALSAVPPFLSARYVDNAFETWRTDLEGAYEDLDRAADLNRLSDLPLLAEGGIARAAGDRERAVAAFTAATLRKPEEWTGHYLLARLQVREDRSAARAEAARALELNPLDSRVRGLAREVGLRPPQPD